MHQRYRYRRWPLPINLVWLVSSLLLAACASGGGGTSPTDGAAETNQDADTSVPAPDTGVPESADAAPDAGAEDVGTEPVPGFQDWDPGLPPAADLGSRRQFQLARTIIHLHSIFSHDACDGKPLLEDGSPNEECLTQLRTALCTDHIDFAMMTDHYTFMAETDNFDDLYLQRGDDAWESDGTAHSANVVHCADGHEARIMVGLEGEASPIGLLRHPVAGDSEARKAAYKDTSAAGVQRLRDAGAAPVAIHIEDRSDDWLRNTDLDLFEICNLHILLAPDIRKQVGLDSGSAAAAFADWVFDPDRYPPYSDLVFLEFHERIPYYMNRWDDELTRRMMGGFAGNDAHQNVMSKPMADGERPDSYRRMMKWYANHLLVESRTGQAAREALSKRRLYQVFEVLGSPAGFDFFAEDQDGQIYEMGDAVPAGKAAALRATAPRPLGVSPGLEIPVRLVLYQITAAGSQAVYDGPGPLEYPNPSPGRYRLEVFITPEHLSDFMENLADELMKEFPWVYSNPIEVR